MLVAQRHCCLTGEDARGGGGAGGFSACLGGGAGGVLGMSGGWGGGVLGMSGGWGGGVRAYSPCGASHVCTFTLCVFWFGVMSVLHDVSAIESLNLRPHVVAVVFRC